MMRHSDFGAMILSHGRPDRVYTRKCLDVYGYTGPVAIVVDDEDVRGDEYREAFGDEVVVFSKREAAKITDVGDNLPERRGVVYARNMSFEIARELGWRTFIMLDDDYFQFRHKADATGQYLSRGDIKSLDVVFDVLLDYFLSIPALSIAMAQGGDFVGGTSSDWWRPKRKAMNTFICSVDRPFKFMGRINEDVNAYCTHGARGELFFTIKCVGVEQHDTQSNKGGLTELYLDTGTYTKSFYSVLCAPGAVKISVLNSQHARIHHKVDWNRAVPKVLSESVRKL